MPMYTKPFNEIRRYYRGKNTLPAYLNCWNLLSERGDALVCSESGRWNLAMVSTLKDFSLDVGKPERDVAIVGQESGKI